MRERVLAVERQYGVKISRTHLYNIYCLHGIRRREASYKFTMGKRTEAELRIMIRQYVKDLIFYMRSGKRIIYIDQTSTHLWEKLGKFYMPIDDPIYLRFKSTRGSSVTIMGAICSKWEEGEFMICEKTNTDNVELFLRQLIPKMDLGNTIVVADNHRAHHANRIQELARTAGFKMLFTPPTCSDYNPIELMWSLFKRQWRKTLWDPEIFVNPENIQRYLRKCLNAVAHHGKRIGRGPTRFMQEFAELEKAIIKPGNFKFLEDDQKAEGPQIQI